MTRLSPLTWVLSCSVASGGGTRAAQVCAALLRYRLRPEKPTAPSEMRHRTPQRRLGGGKPSYSAEKARGSEPRHRVASHPPSIPAQGVGSKLRKTAPQGRVGWREMATSPRAARRAAHCRIQETNTRGQCSGDWEQV